jgi:predicted peptidase
MLISCARNHKSQPVEQPKGEPAKSEAAEARASEIAASGLVTRTVSVGGSSYDYQVYIPESLRGAKDAPVVLFLHGIGQRGAGGLIPSAGEIANFARIYLEQIPAIIVMPQCREGRYWPHKDMTDMAVAALDRSVAEFGADTRREYLVGASMGGYGAWHIASEYPGKFAAVVPICGGSPIRAGNRFAPIANKMGRTPVWVFHGAADRTVPVAESRNMVKALKEANGNVRYSEYPGVGHAVWLNVLSEPELLPWLMSQRL